MLEAFADNKILIIVLSSVILFLLYLTSHLFHLSIKNGKISKALLKIIELRQLISRKNTLGEIMDITFNALKHILPSQSAVIYLLEKNQKNQTILNVSEIMSPSGQKFTAFDPLTTDSVLSQTFKNKKTCKIDNFDKMPRDIIAKDSNFKSMMITPVTDNGESIGLIVLAHNKYGYFKEEDLEILHIFSAEAASVIKNIHSVHLSAAATQTDSVSGMYTYGHFRECLKESVKKHKDENKNLSVLFLNIDYFKQVNDTFGHNAGDTLIKQLGSFIKEQLRKHDFIGRYDADEFAVIMPDMSKTDCVVASEKIRHEIQEHTFILDGKPVKITISCGLSHLSENTASEKELIEKAQKALREAKNKGRNKIFVNE